jgi:hypothetical protein
MFLALTALVAAPVLAQPSAWLSHAEIHASLSGKSIAGRYASGRPFTERYLANGQIEYIENGRTLGGHWSVTSGTLCTIYDGDPTGGCFRVARAGDNCFEFYFVPRTEDAAPGPKDLQPAWTARGAIEGAPSACRDGASV